MDNYSLGFALSNLGSKSYQKILTRFGSTKKAWNGTQDEYKELQIKGVAWEKFSSFKNTFDTEQYNHLLEEKKVKFISYIDADYPVSLKALSDPPIGIFCIGNTALLKENFSIGVVGTRKITEYGKFATDNLVGELVDRGACIVSGLALGVDAMAHRSALSRGGKTIGVLACGVNCCRPSENHFLYKEILNSNNLVLSEYPLSVNPNKGTFLMRNRIIAALSHGVLVTEAAQGSGSIVTAEWGFRLSKKVFAVPGLINSPMSRGSMSLIKRGAVLTTEVEDVLKEFRVSGLKKSFTSSIKRINLTEEEQLLFDLIQMECQTVDELVKKADFEAKRVSRLLVGLELLQLVKFSGGKWCTKQL